MCAKEPIFDLPCLGICLDHVQVAIVGGLHEQKCEGDVEYVACRCRSSGHYAINRS
jgi:hypothetical protein